MSTSDAERRVESVAGSTEQKSDQSPEQAIPFQVIENQPPAPAQVESTPAAPSVGEPATAPTNPADVRAGVSAIRAQEIPSEEKRLRIAELFLRHIIAIGGKMLRTLAGEAFIAVGGRVIPIRIEDENLGFFLLEHGGIIIAMPEGRCVVQVLRSHALAKGVETIVSSDLTHADPDRATLLVNLNDDLQTLLEVSPSGVRTIPNGDNPQRILLLPSTIRPIAWRDVEVGAAMGVLKRIVFDSIPCSPAERMFVMAFPVASILTGLMSNRIIVKLSGATGGAKSTVAAMLTKLMNGQTDPETTRLVRDLLLAAGSNFVLSLENLEQRDITRGLQRFLLCMATGLRFTSRRLYSDADPMVSQPRCFVVLNSIEPFSQPELLNRSFDIVVDRSRFGVDGFEHTEVLAAIERHRDEILSGIFLMIGREILPTFAARKKEIMAYLAEKHRGHFTERSDEAIAVIGLCAERLQHHFEGRSDLFPLLDAWISSQDERGRALVAETNPLVLIFGRLGDALLNTSSGSATRVRGLKVTAREEPGIGRLWEFECSSAELLSVIVTISREVGHAQPFKNAGCLSARLRNSLPALAGIGWSIRMTAKIVNGIGVHRFTFTVPRTEEELPVAAVPAPRGQDAA